jgi:radical SAM-linked protein
MKVRVRFTKVGKIRWTSHRDVARMWERALRRAKVAVAYSEGFSPRPRISFGLALPTGAESLAEYLDVELTEPRPAWEDLASRLSAGLPSGLDVTAVCALEAGAPSLQHDVECCRWEITVPAAIGNASEVEKFLTSPTVVVTRQRKGQEVTDDIRPVVRSLQIDQSGTSQLLAAELATGSRGLRPSELLDALGMDISEARMVRSHQWIQRDGVRREPIPAPDAPPAQRQAS